MNKEIFNKIYEMFGKSPLELSVDEDTIFLQNDDETIGIGKYKLDESKLNIFYFTFYKELAKKTLEDCPDSIKEWCNQLNKLRIEGEYIQVPFFNISLNYLEDALKICFYLGSKMEANVTNQQKVHKVHN